MGYRLHFAKHYEPDWQGGVFNHASTYFEDLFLAKFSDNGWSSENEDQYEVYRGDVEAYIKELKKLKADAVNEFFPANHNNDGYTNKEVIATLEEILTSEDDYIRLEWF